ncbi:hypothetical protein FISHEDRAFT_59245 [Fistulina hepatica ATCC 64428]|uniref:C2H2-type domain-containing protein n=1 Tax=Fistulina hepatica ATCC 64428 TaxID=1128425 RepID=A0A0D7ADV1_9AGAR|nr:hypothetical protein FISHEDRAFT_59245 [Fistulina hepatica ATCC 64428]
MPRVARQSVTKSTYSEWVDDSCPKCGRRISRPADRARHMKTHLPRDLRDKECFKCPESGCKYKTLQKSNLSTHLNTHYKLKPYVCPYAVCGYRSGDRAQLHRHKVRAHCYVPKQQLGRHAEHLCDSFVGHSTTSASTPARPATPASPESIIDLTAALDLSADSRDTRSAVASPVSSTFSDLDEMFSQPTTPTSNDLFFQPTSLPASAGNSSTAFADPATGLFKNDDIASMNLLLALNNINAGVEPDFALNALGSGDLSCLDLTALGLANPFVPTQPQAFCGSTASETNFSADYMSCPGIPSPFDIPPFMNPTPSPTASNFSFESSSDDLLFNNTIPQFPAGFFNNNAFGAC